MPSFKNKSRIMGSRGELQPTLSSKPFKSLEANEQAAPLGLRSSYCTDSVLWRPEDGVPSDLTHTVCLLWMGEAARPDLDVCGKSSHTPT